jgi:hypothetical protein
MKNDTASLNLYFGSPLRGVEALPLELETRHEVADGLDLGVGEHRFVEGYGLAEVVIESEERPDRSHRSLRGVSPRTHQTAATRQFGAVFLRLFWDWPLADAARGRPVPRIRKGSK